VAAQLQLFEDGGCITSKRSFQLEGKRHVKVKMGGDIHYLEAARRCSIKLSDGDIRGAAKILCSNESYKAQDKLSFDLLTLKHHPRLPDSRSSPSQSTAPVSMSSAEVLAALRSFSPNSSGGVDGLHP